MIRSHTWIPLASIMIIMTFAASVWAGKEFQKKLPTQECVILLHGLCRSSRSMLKIQKHLEKAGYAVGLCFNPKNHRSSC